MRLEAKKYLYDIVQAAKFLSHHTSAKRLDEYLEDEVLQAAVERKFSTIGEALAQLAVIDHGTAESITNLRRIIGFRNVLVHGYADVDHRIVWDVLSIDLPVLLREAEELLQGS
jgi:uncharacterized protein with HEPN domain